MKKKKKLSTIFCYVFNYSSFSCSTNWTIEDFNLLINELKN